MPVTANTLPLLLKWRFAVIIGRDMLECDAELLSKAAPGSPGYSLSRFGLDRRQSFSRK